MTYYVKKTNKLIFNGISDFWRIGLTLLVIVVITGLFTKVHEGVGAIFGSSMFMLANALGFLSFSTILVYGLGGLFFVLGVFLVITRGGVMA